MATMTNSPRIAFFDSGLGGITVLAEALQQLPGEDYLYYADSGHAPYGDKDKETVRAYILAAAAAIAAHGVKALVVACNTATSIAINDLRALYRFPVIGMEPAVKPAVQHNCGNKRVLVLATQLTLKEEKFRRLLTTVDPANTVDYLATPELVNWAERECFDNSILNSYFARIFAAYDLKQYSTLVLGCTHFVFYRPLLQRWLPAHIALIDGNRGTIKHLEHMLHAQHVQGQGQASIEWLISAKKAIDTGKFERMLALARQIAR